jgi:hypothetical protein
MALPSKVESEVPRVEHVTPRGIDCRWVEGELLLDEVVGEAVRCVEVRVGGDPNGGVPRPTRRLCRHPPPMDFLPIREAIPTRIFLVPEH